MSILMSPIDLALDGNPGSVMPGFVWNPDQNMFQPTGSTDVLGPTSFVDGGGGGAPGDTTPGPQAIPPGSPGNEGHWGADGSWIPAGQSTNAPQGDPRGGGGLIGPGLPSTVVQGNIGSGQMPSNYQQMQQYNANPPDPYAGLYPYLDNFSSDPTGMAAYMNSLNGNPYQSPAQLAALAAGMNAFGNMQGQIGAAQAAANASEFGSHQNLLGTQNTNATNALLGKLGLQGQLGVAGLNLQGVQNTNQANQAIAGTQAGAQEQVASTQANAAMQAALDQLLGTGVTAQASQNIAGIQNVPALSRLALLQQLLGGGSGGAGGLNPGLSLGGGIAGAGGAGVGLGNVGGSGTGGIGGGGVAGAGGLNTSGSGQPAVAQMQPMNAQQLQANLGAGEAAINQRYADLRNNLLQSAANRGMNVTGAAGGLNPGLQAQLAQRENQDLLSNDLQFGNFASQLNNQNALAYNSQNLGQYNANQNRALQLLGIQIPYSQGQASAGFGLLSGLLG